MCIRKDNKKKKKSGVSSLRRWNKNWFLILLAIASKFGLQAEEIYNAKIVETYADAIGQTGYYNAGVDVNGDGITDLFIVVPFVGGRNPSPISTRLAGFLREGANVSFDDKDKRFDKTMSAYTVGDESLLEIEGKSVLLYFPGVTGEKNFPYESARQKRLSSQPTAPFKSNDALTPEEQRLLLELLRKQQGNQ